MGADTREGYKVMILVTASELNNRTTESLTLIFHDFAKRLPRTEPGAIERPK